MGLGVVASVALLALLCAGCAVGRSPSMAAAPLRLVYTTAGDLEVSRAEDADFGEAVALVGDFRSGVDGYDIVGGNALLPVRRPLPDLTVGLGQTAAISANLPGLNGDPLAASATLSGLTNASVAAALAAPTPTRAPGANLAAAVNAAGQVPTAVSADLTPAGPTVSATAAGATVAAGVASGPPAASVAAGTVAATVAVPVQTPVSPILTIQGPVLDAPAPAPPVAVATSLGGAAVNSLLDPLRRFP